MSRPVCVVFAYGHFGHAGIAALRRAGAYLPLVLSHADNPADNCWWPSVHSACATAGIPVLLDAELKTGSAALARIAQLRPDYLFSFYYKHLLGAEVLAIGRRGAYNLHGSLLPKYRGRAPINWQLVHGESESGLTLHEMVPRADAGRIVLSSRVAVDPDQDAYGLTQQLLDLAPAFLDRALAGLFSGHARLRTQDLSQGSVFPGRRPQDGMIDWHAPARTVHNLVRAVAPPWPGAFTRYQDQRLMVLSTRVVQEHGVFAPAGTVLGDGTIACGDGTIEPIGIFDATAQPQQLIPGTTLSTTHGVS